MREDYLNKIESYREDMIADLAALVRCRSVQGEAEEGAPFGRGVAEAYKCMMQIAEREGLTTFDADGYGGHIDWKGSQDAGTMGILCHLDVVPEGKDWKHDPYGAEMEDGCMYGRGTLDDKGPTIAAFYAVKALRACGITPKKSVRMIVGLDEETGSEGMEYYKKRVDMPDFAIVPDAEFPLVNGEKGIMVFDLGKPVGEAVQGGIALKDIQGGKASNMVPDSASALIVCEGGYEDILSAVENYRAETGHSVTAELKEGGLEIVCAGKAAHGAMPWKGLNAVSILMELLGGMTFDRSGINEFIAFYNSHIGFDLEGAAMGCHLQDEMSGNLSWNSGVLSMSDDKIVLTVNVRCPVSFDDEMFYASIMPVLEACSVELSRGMYKAPLYYSTDSDIVKTLMSVYRKHTGDETTEPFVIGGGTYAREMENAIAFGALFPGDPDLMHQADECISIDRLILTAKIYAEAICRLAECE